MTHRRITALLVSTFLTAWWLPALAAAEAPAPTTVRIVGDHATALEAVGLAPVRSLDYGSYLQLELEAGDLERLAASGVPYAELPQAGQVRVMGYHFDPVTEGEPALPEHLLAAGEGPALRLVQFHGPARAAWLDEVAAAGARVLQYYPHDTYLVWADAEQAAALAQRPFVRWQGAFHPGYKVHSSLEGRSGEIDQVDVMVYDDGDLKATLLALEALGARRLQLYPSQPDRAFWNVLVRLDAGALEPAARLRSVLWLGYQSPEPILDDEMSSQIVAGNTPGGVPSLGYQTWLAGLGYDGTGVIWSTTDTGVDYTHPDLGPRIVGGHNYPGCVFASPGDDPSSGGHGTHVSGIIGGDATGGFTDADGFLYGLGMAPGYSIFAQNPICGTQASWPPAGGWQELSKRGVLGGALGANNSWTSGEGTAHGYQASERTHDFMVRDGDFDTPGAAEPYTIVFSAGNSGPGTSTLTAPKEAKNVIVTAGTQNYRVSSNVDAMYSSSSRGPAVDGRYVPTIAAPGQQIASTRNNDGGSCGTAISGTSGLYSFCTGTSMAAPHAAGTIVLIAEWWRDQNAGADPSPAMSKALLANGAVDITGAPPIPNFDEGWGRINAANVIDPAVFTVYRDQEDLFDGAGEEFTFAYGVADTGQPLKVSVAWSDAPGAVGANPALVNDLDLEVETGGSTYLGNQFSGGWSATGGSADTLNNLENVFVQSPGGAVTITVRATNLAGDGIPLAGDATDQDFALVCTNCVPEPTFTLASTPATQEVCAPADAVYGLEIGSVLGFSDPVTLAVSGEPAGTTTGFSVNPVSPPGTSDLTISGTGGATAGHYDLVVTGTSGATVRNRGLGLDLFTGLPGQVTLLTPADGATNQPASPTLTWSEAASGGGGTYTVEIATDAGFSNVVDSASGLTEATYTPANLDTNTVHYWRVRATNACGTDADSATFSFTTEPAPGDCTLGITPVREYETDFESGTAGWTTGGSMNTWTISSARTHSGVAAFHAEDLDDLSDQYLISPPVALPSASAPLTLQFWNHQTIEDRTGGCYDGAVVEISTDGGSSWTRLEAELLTDPYDGPVSTGFDSAIGGDNAWCGDPQDWLESIVDLDAWAGQTVQFRFRLATDTIVGREGWYVDDVVVQSCPDPATFIFSDGFESGNLSAWSSSVP